MLLLIGAAFSLIILTSCSGGNVAGNSPANSQNSIATSEFDNEEDIEEGTIESTEFEEIFEEESESDEGITNVCTSEDGLVTIRSTVSPSGGTSPSYSAVWTITCDDGKKRRFLNPGDYAQNMIHTIHKNDGSMYYLVNCSAKASSSDGYAWFKAYKIVDNTIKEVGVKDGGKVTEEFAFEVNYVIPDCYYRTYGAAYDWLLEYDPKSKNIYMAITDDYRCITDHYEVWHFNGNKFVYHGKQVNRHLHKSLADYQNLILYCTTNDYIMRVDTISGKGLRYASWKKPKTMSDEPDIVISGGKRMHYHDKQDGFPRQDDYHFFNDGCEYIVGYGETEKLDDGIFSHNDFLVVKRDGMIIEKQKVNY